MATTKLTGTLIRSGSIPTWALGGGVVTSSGQLTNILPVGTVSASSQIDYNSIQNKLSSVVSSSTQVQSLLPGGTVSSSAQFNSLTSPFSGSFTGSFTGAHTGSILAAGVVSNSAQYPGWMTSSTQVVWASVPYDTGIVSSSTQIQPLLPGGTVSSSGQVDYNSITNKLSGVVSSSAQIQPLLPNGTISSSAQLPAGTVSASSQVQLSGITGTTFAAADFVFPQSLKVTNTLTATQFNVLSSSIIYTSGSTQFGDTPDDVMSVTGSIRVLSGSISGSMVGMFSSSAQVDYNSITNKLSGVVSSSTQVQPLLPNGTVSSSAQYPGWVTASSQIDYNSITNKLSGVYSSSVQAVAAIAGQTIAPSIINATGAISGASIQTSGNGTIGGTLAVTSTTTLSGNVTATATSSLSASRFTGTVSGSGNYRMVIPVGTNLYAT
jgi:hypothetical protein